MTAPRTDPRLEAVPPPPPAWEPEPAEPQVDLLEQLHVILDARWLVLAVTAAALALGAGYAWLATPIFRSDMLLQVEDKKSSMGAMGDLASMFGSAGWFSDTSRSDAEIEILHSRTISGAVVDALRLDLTAEPVRMRLLGRLFGNRQKGDALADPFLGLSSYAWGGERLQLDRLDVPERLLGKALTLVAGEGGRFTLLDPDGEPLGDGVAGSATSAGPVNLFVAELRAHPGTRFRLSRRDREAATQDLQAQLKVAEKGKRTGILVVSLDGPDRRRIIAILDAVAAAYIRQNVDRKSAEAAKTLEFLETQLPVVHATLDGAEAELERYRTRKGGLDVTLATQSVVARSVELEKNASALQVEYVALRQRFTETHPAVLGLRDKLRQLDGERATIEARLKQLPEAELESARRLRDVKVANELYLTLLAKAQELKVAKAGTLGDVRVLDPALRLLAQVAPQQGQILGLALFLGLLGGVGLAFARRALDQGIEDPDQLERASNIPVFASVPFSAAEARRDDGKGMPGPLLAVLKPRDLAVESLRSLRTALQFALVEAGAQVVAVSGPAPGVGKSFVTANLGHLLAEAGKRVVVVDADIRRGTLHRHFGHERGLGLADVIAGLPLEQALRQTDMPGLALLTSGTLPPNPAELLGSERLARLIGELAGKFDLVLLDTPPVLAVTDAALVARHAGVNLLVARSGQHPLRELLAATRLLGRSGIRTNGFVLNAVRLDRGLGRRSVYHYQYKYE
jgi:tyrosine-protein kinase Etk/Wzc